MKTQERIKTVIKFKKRKKCWNLLNIERKEQGEKKKRKEIKKEAWIVGEKKRVVKDTGGETWRVSWRLGFESGW